MPRSSPYFAVTLSVAGLCLFGATIAASLPLEKLQNNAPELHVTTIVGGKYRKLEGSLVWFADDDTLNLTCYIQGYTLHTMSWWEEGMVLDVMRGKIDFQSYSKVSLIGLSSMDDGRQLTCKIDDMEISRPVELRRKAPEPSHPSLHITTIEEGNSEGLQGSLVMFDENDHLDLTCYIHGFSLHTLTWWEGDMGLEALKGKGDFQSYSKVSLTGLSSRDDGRQLTCEVDDMELSRTVELRKKVPKAPKPSLHITTIIEGSYERLQGNLVWFDEDGNLDLTCFIQDQTLRTLLWWENDKELKGKHGKDDFQSFSKLSLTGLSSRDDGRQLTCEVDEMELSRTVELRKNDATHSTTTTATTTAPRQLTPAALVAAALAAGLVLSAVVVLFVWIFPCATKRVGHYMNSNAYDKPILPQEEKPDDDNQAHAGGNAD